ncbi:AAA family ATPase [Caldiplasma sukawensis]
MKFKIILIGGIPGVGKTSLSGELARRYGFNIMMSGDYIRESIREFVTKEIISLSVYEAWKVYGEKNAENIVRGFVSQGELVNRATNRIIKRAINNGEPMIIETLYFIPEQLILKNENVIPFYIKISDREEHVNRLNNRQNYTHFNSPGERLSAQLDTYRYMMDYSVSECLKSGIMVFDNMNYENTKMKIMEYVGEMMR